MTIDDQWANRPIDHIVYSIVYGLYISEVIVWADCRDSTLCEPDQILPPDSDCTKYFTICNAEFQARHFYNFYNLLTNPSQSLKYYNLKTKQSNTIDSYILSQIILNYQKTVNKGKHTKRATLQPRCEQ